jgi:cytochrome c oxidase subunit 4
MEHNAIFGTAQTSPAEHAAESVAVPPAHHDDHNSPEHIKKEIRVYLLVFAALAVLTAITVWLCFGLHMPVKMAILIALIVASIKGFLVAGFFMHLLSERKLIYAILGLTVFFFAVLMWGPWHDVYDKFGK